MTAPDQCCRNVRKLLPRRRPHVTQYGIKDAARSTDASVVHSDGPIDASVGFEATFKARFYWVSDGHFESPLPLQRTCSDPARKALRHFAFATNNLALGPALHWLLADQAALKLCERHADGLPATFVFLGDYIDRGPDSRGVTAMLIDLQLRQSHRVIALKGNNNEAFAIGVVDGELSRRSGSAKATLLECAA